MEKEVYVHIDLQGTPIFVGKLWARWRRGRESASFEYDHTWLKRPDRFALEPLLSLAAGQHHTPLKKAIFGAMGDSAPDRWGRLLMRRLERRAAKRESRDPRSLMEIDYLLLVNDATRQGALRFSDQKKGPFLNDSLNEKIPPLVDLPKLLTATENISDESETYEDLKLLLAPGSSLGGARPKASVRERDGRLAIAKFPHKEDEYNNVLWEAHALTLAEQAKIIVPAWRIETINKRPVLLLQRFDRDEKSRIPFLSAMSMLGANDNESRSYIEIADALKQHGAQPAEDMHNLWRRMVFNILISNTDDHLRNHGFLYVQQKGWKLSPAYDLNPTPTDIKPRVLSTTIDYEDGTASIDLALSVAKYFNLSLSQAKKIAKQVATTINDWQSEAKKLNIPKYEIERMSSAFEHQDIKAAISLHET